MEKEEDESYTNFLSSFEPCIRGFFQNMPKEWVYVIHVLDEEPQSDESFFDLKIDLYLKKMGFTGKPVYECTNCRDVKFISNSKWSVISQHYPFSCPQCKQGKLMRVDVPYGEKIMCHYE
jgi:hypothetical protein